MYVAILAALSGCSSQGYVESDLPGVAQWFGTRAIQSNVARSCANYGAAYGSYSETTTEVGLTRTRVEYKFQCK